MYFLLLFQWREKTSEYPFNLNQALGESACGMRRLYARDCSHWREGHRTGQNEECGIFVYIDLNEYNDVSDVWTDYISFRILLIFLKR